MRRNGKQVSGEDSAVLDEIEKDRRKQFEEYFRTAPMWLMDTFVVEELEKGTVFVQEESLQT